MESVNVCLASALPPGFALAFPEDYASAVKVIGGKLHFYGVSRYYTDVMFAHFAAQMGKDDVLVLQFHAEHCVWKGFLYHTFNFNSFVFISHKFLQNSFAFFMIYTYTSMYKIA